MAVVAVKGGVGGVVGNASRLVGVVEGETAAVDDAAFGVTMDEDVGVGVAILFVLHEFALEFVPPLPLPPPLVSE